MARFCLAGRIVTQPVITGQSISVTIGQSWQGDLRLVLILFVEPQCFYIFEVNRPPGCQLRCNKIWF